MSHTVHLGYEVGTGQPVSVPVRNTVVTGQTQESGKTTTLEALIERSGLRALAFVTKRGESGFSGGRRIRPYFRERADWEYVAGILEAERGEKLKFERAWIIKACRGAKTLGDVHRNVRESLKTARGLAESVFTTLDAYLDNVVPSIAAADFAPSIDLKPGLNVMDLGALSTSVQQLVIASAMQWVYREEKDVVTVLPEAWEFAPQGRRSPAKLAAAELVRKGSVLKNFLWLDSQDIAGVEKELLRSCPVWLIGVQREFNEIKRALANIPAGIAKPGAGDIAGLERGQFYACWGKHAIKTYVQPAWMLEDHARDIALGKLAIDAVIRRRGDAERRREREPEPRVTVGPKAHPPAAPSLNWPATSTRPTKQHSNDEDDMSKEDVDRLEAGLATISKQLTGLRRLSDQTNAAQPPPPAPTITGNGEFDEDALYQRFKQRLMDEPAEVLALAVKRARIDVTIEEHVIELDEKSMDGKLAAMIADQLFDEPRTGSWAYTWLKNNRAYTSSSTNVYDAMARLVKKGFLRKEAGAYVKVKGAEVRIKK